MKQIFNNFLTALFVVLLYGMAAQAQSDNKTNEKVISEIAELRQKLIDSIKKRDKNWLESFYADDFTHTHASGQVDDKTKRLAALLSNEQTIESAEVNEINIRVYGKTTAIAVGQSAITDAQKKKTFYRWTIVYVKSGKRWQIAASQATKLTVNV